MIVTTNLKNFQSELMEVVRLFPEAEGLGEAVHFGEQDGTLFVNRFYLDGRECVFRDEGGGIDPLSFRPLSALNLLKRYAKLALYKILSERFGRALPWGALTGIRPTRLAYGELYSSGEFTKLFSDMQVSKENTALTQRVIEGQRGIYERREGNCDLYVSLPFCPTKCTYCSFITAPIDKTRQYIPDYLTALEREAAGVIGLIGNLRSVYIGGGTPFALDPADLERALKIVQPLAGGVEFTVEAGRPDVFTEEKLELCKKYGVTRICINAQSFSDRTLNAIGRKHTVSEVYRAFEMAKPYGFTVNCDLIAGLTGESLEEFCGSIDSAISLSPENITVHTLCLKKGAQLKEEVARLGEGELDRMIAYSREKLTAAGYEPYYLYRQKYMAGAHENVGWTKRGFASVYNIDVMEEIASNLAIGANAVTKRIFLSEGRIERQGNPKDIPTYIQKVEKIIEDKKKLFE